MAAAAAAAPVSAGACNPVALPDAFLDAGALPTLHDRYGLATDRIVERVLGAALSGGPTAYSAVGGTSCRQSAVGGSASSGGAMTVSGLVGLTKTNLREQALASLRTAITSGQLPPETRWSRPSCPSSSRSAGARCARPCDSCSRKACWWRPPAVGSTSDGWAPRRSRTSSRSGRPSSASPPSMLAARDDRIQLGRAAPGPARHHGPGGDDEDLERRIEADLDFHRVLCALTGNEMLLHTWQSLEGSIRMSIMFAGPTGPGQHGCRPARRHRRRDRVR